MWYGWLLHQLATSHLRFLFFEHALICIRPPHPSFDFALHPQLEKKTNTDQVLLLLLLIPYLMYALFFTCIATTAESTPAFHSSSFQPAPYDSNQTNIHHITHPLFFPSNPVLLHQRLVFHFRKDSRLENAIKHVSSISVQLQIGGFDSMSLTHSLTHSCPFAKLYVGFRERKKQQTN